MRSRLVLLRTVSSSSFWVSWRSSENWRQEMINSCTCRGYRSYRRQEMFDSCTSVKTRGTMAEKGNCLGKAELSRERDS